MTNWTGVITGSLQSLWISVVNFLPNILGALLVFIIGLIVAALIAKLVEKIFELVKLDHLLAKAGLAPYFERAGMRLRAAHFLGRLVYWFIVIAFLLAAVNALNLTIFADFLGQALAFLGNVVIAVLIMLATMVLANLVRSIVHGSVASARLGNANFLGSLAWWAIVIFGLLAALSQLNVAATVINSLIIGVIAMISLAGGLAFGLGGREQAADVLRRMRDGHK
jgi:hypothetical protein